MLLNLEFLEQILLCHVKSSDSTLYLKASYITQHFIFHVFYIYISKRIA